MHLQTSKARTGSKDSNLTPAKLLLMHRERQMNMLSPHDGSSVHQMDIETGKTVAEWSFKKVRQWTRLDTIWRVTSLTSHLCFVCRTEWMLL